MGDFSILIHDIWHPLLSLDHIKAVPNHYFTAGLLYFLATLNLSKCVFSGGRGEGGPKEAFDSEFRFELFFDNIACSWNGLRDYVLFQFWGAFSVFEQISTYFG